jgi:putative SOS response-associated peptidase YedK
LDALGLATGCIVPAMCGRFTLTRPDLDELVREFGGEVDAETARLYRPRWNFAPTNSHVILELADATKRLVPARFGLDAPGGRLVINARSETAATLRTFRNAFAHERCVVPADGFYEWQGSREDRRPLWFHAPGSGLLLFAGLAFEHQGERSFVILTTAANDLLRPIHDRMPALLSFDGARRGSRGPWKGSSTRTRGGPRLPRGVATRERGRERRAVVARGTGAAAAAHARVDGSA